MTNNLQSTSADGRGIIEFDANIIGTGVSGFCRLYHLRHFGQKVRLFEEGGDV
jgi:cation diffusion facilitator CzcD-associated flavoprotein CzcO